MQVSLLKGGKRQITSFALLIQAGHIAAKLLVFSLLNSNSASTGEAIIEFI